MDNTQYIVRRLTPTECERLQGYPDGWTDLKPIEDMSDEDVLFWQNALLETEAREGRARQDENGVWWIWKCTEVPPSDPARDDIDPEEPELVWENTGKEYKHKTKAQLIAWYNRSFCDCDSKRYKAMGNSIALPQWRFTLERMAAYLPPGATLGSLFDGVGGFPLIWEGIHGAGTALWASEIELFPIAVTRYRFKEE